MSKEKYAEANVLTFQKLGLPDFVQDKNILSKKEQDIARKCILLLKKRIKRLCILPDKCVEQRYSPKNPVWIPYQDYLGKSLPASRGTDMRSAKYVGSLLSVITIAKSIFLLDDGEGNLSAIARSEDLIETLRIAQNLVSGDYYGLPANKVKFYKEILLPAYNAKERPDEKNGKEEPLQAVTTRELSDYYRKVTGKSISTDNLKKQFLDELKVNDLIGEMKSEIDGRRSIFYPLTPPVPVNAHEKIKKLSNEDIIDDISYFPTLELSRDYKYIPKDWLILQIFALAKYRIDLAQALGPFADYLNQSEKLKFLKINNFADADSHTRLSIREFILEYEPSSSISIRYIFKADFYGFYSEYIGFMREVCLLDKMQCKKMSNYTAFDNFVISDDVDIKTEDPSTKIEYPPKCYHCNVNGFTTKDEYERHVVGHHRNLPCYPGPPDLEKLGLVPQSMPWERELPRDRYFDFELESKG